jgi:hypothetical protein
VARLRSGQRHLDRAGAGLDHVRPVNSRAAWHGSRYPAKTRPIWCCPRR